MLATFLARRRPGGSIARSPGKLPIKYEVAKSNKVQNHDIEGLMVSFKKLIIDDKENVAAAELKTRVSQLICAKNKQRFLSMGSFHTHQNVRRLGEKKPTSIYGGRGVFVQKRFYSEIHAAHLNEKGLIREEILDQRRLLLQKHGLLQDEMDYLGRQVYANYHLYSTDPNETIGLINLNRMRYGKAPFDKKGKKVIVIHHFDQTHEGPWVILSEAFHQMYDTDLHSNITLIKGVRRNRFNHERAAYWKSEADRLELCNFKKKRTNSS
ncbi:MAG: hypothetical protein BGO43_11365 [Gammaproteobacteria bacterium 39-13]|nr:hypothetical protein [Gammaproteobacteria bacterium]OJV85233.1 MAG: hypothetical protein BGO43_11365 [Gammaproteobacteria bacterium 39-13]